MTFEITPARSLLVRAWQSFFRLVWATRCNCSPPMASTGDSVSQQSHVQAAAGSIVGCLLGALMTWGVSHIPIHLRGLLYTNYFLVTWDWRHYVFATLLAILAVFIASYVPARRAAELPPVVTIRGSR